MADKKQVSVGFRISEEVQMKLDQVTEALSKKKDLTMTATQTFEVLVHEKHRALKLPVLSPEQIHAYCENRKTTGARFAREAFASVQYESTDDMLFLDGADGGEVICAETDLGREGILVNQVRPSELAEEPRDELFVSVEEAGPAVPAQPEILNEDTGDSVVQATSEGAPESEYLI